MSYNIIIDEAQRARIEAALRHLDKTNPVTDDGTLEGFGVSVLTEMFKDLPEAEAEHPGIVHGFCI